MKQLFDYCFYRIALFYKNRMPFEDYITQGHTLLISVLGFYAIALTNLLLHIFGIKLSKELLIVIIIPFFIVIFLNNRFFPNSGQLFEKKKKEYENERCKWCKGLLVFLSVLGSFVSMVFSYF